MFVEVSVPGRVNLFGNPLDIYGGLVISSSLARRATVYAQSSNGLRLTMGNQDCVIRDSTDLHSRNDPFDFLRALIRSLGVVPDCQIRTTTDIPIRSGLAGSAALMLAASACLLTFTGKPASRTDILRTARRAEVEFLNNFCGWNDFYACSLGESHEILYQCLEDDSPVVTPLKLRGGGVSFSVALTGDMHRSGAVNLNLWQRWRNGDPIVKTEYEKLASLGQSASEAFRMEDWAAFGRLMLENFLCQYRLGAANEIENDLVQRAMSLGALGAKLCGAGHCGSIVILARDGDHDHIRLGLEQVGAQQYYKVAPTEGLLVRQR